MGAGSFLRHPLCQRVRGREQPVAPPVRRHASLSRFGGTATRTARTQGFTRTGLYRRRINAPVTHHGLDGLVTSLDRRRPKRPLFEAGVRYGSRRRGGGVAGRDPSRHQAPASRTPPRCSAIRVVARRQREQAGPRRLLVGGGAAFRPSRACGRGATRRPGQRIPYAANVHNCVARCRVSEGRLGANVLRV